MDSEVEWDISDQEGMHDYDPSWDYELDIPHEHLKSILAKIETKLKNDLLPAMGIPKYKLFFTPEMGIHGGAVGVYCNGTYGCPIIGLDLHVIEDNCSTEHEVATQIEMTIVHELAHAYQESIGVEHARDHAGHEDEAESFARDYVDYGEIDLKRLGRDVIDESATTAAPRYFIHCTAGKNVASITKQGLIPNGGAAPLMGGNYEDSRWITLEGVYATIKPQLIINYIRAHGIQNHYGLVVIEAHPEDLLPDEDIIEDLLIRAFKAAGGKRFHEIDDEEFEPRHWQDPWWEKVRRGFHEMASNGQEVPYDDDMLETLVSYWTDFEWDGGDVGPDEWATIKDKVARHYPMMVHPDHGPRHSVRVPGKIGFTGRTRIVAVLDVTPTDIKTSGEVPAATQDMIDDITEAV